MDHAPSVPIDLTGVTTLGKIQLYRRQKQWVEILSQREDVQQLNQANCVLQFIRSSITIPIRD